jgi:hypothetical protein
MHGWPSRMITQWRQQHVLLLLLPPPPPHTHTHTRAQIMHPKNKARTTLLTTCTAAAAAAAVAAAAATPPPPTHTHTQIMHLKNEVRTTLAEYKSPTGVYVKGERCWNVDTHVDIALPCATQVRPATCAAAAVRVLDSRCAG